MTARELSLPLVARAAAHADRIAVAAPEGTFRYRDLLDASAAVAARLLTGAEDLHEARVAFLVPPGFTYVASNGASGGPEVWPCRWPSPTRRPS